MGTTYKGKVEIPIEKEEQQPNRKKRAMSRNGGVNERLLESENNKLSDQLARKISTLKQISIDMKNDVDGDLKYLDNMGSDLGSLVDRLLPGTSKRFSKMMDTRGNKKIMCYTVAFLVFGFVLLHYLISYRT